MRLPVLSYFDLDDVAALEETVPITFVVPSFSLGRDLSTSTISSSSSEGVSHGLLSSEGEPVAEVMPGCTACVPLWAAFVLREGGYAAVHSPPRFSIAALRQFKTDPLAPSLHALSAHYYAVGLTLCALLGNPPPPQQSTNINSAVVAFSAEGRRLAAQLFRLYQLRYMKVIASAAKKGFDLSDIREKLTGSERVLLDAVLRGKAEERAWYAERL